MPVDRENWAEQFDRLPAWTCPTCRKGNLIQIEDKFWLEETGPSKAAFGHPEWDPDWILNRFAGFLRCSLTACGEVASISGTSPTDYHHDWLAKKYVLEPKYVVRSIDPAPLPIRIPEAVPVLVSGCISEAAALLWRSSEAAANQLRQAVEHMMDDLGIPQLGSTKKVLTLHARIVEFQKNDNENGEVLLATKWLGNSGSHASGLTRDNVLDAFDMLEFVLENLYGTKKALLAKAAAINAAKGPIKTKGTP